MKYLVLILGILGYGFLYVFYYFVIQFLHSSFSIVSIPAVVVPYLILIFVVYHFRGKRRGKQFYTALALFFLPVIFLLVQLGINESNSRFSTEKWQNQVDERVHMVDHLLQKYSLETLTKGEITRLLGKPTEPAYFTEPNNIVYYLGPERGLISIDSEWLVIWFDEHDRVTQFKILRD